MTPNEYEAIQEHRVVEYCVIGVGHDATVSTFATESLFIAYDICTVLENCGDYQSLKVVTPHGVVAYEWSYLA